MRLERNDNDEWAAVATATTDGDGRVRDLGRLAPGRHRLVFDTAAYLGSGAFFPEVVVVFEVTDPDRHLHVPLLLSPYSFTTYRGS